LPPKSGRNGKNASANENFAAALTEVSDRLTRLVQDEIELAKTEVLTKASSLARGAAAVAAGAVFGVFAVVFFLLTLAWVLDGIFVTGAGSLWLGFLIVLILLLALTGGAFMFAWKKLKVGAPTPKMAIDEGKKIKDTVAHFGNGNGNGHGSPEQIAAMVSAIPLPSPVLATDPAPRPGPLPVVSLSALADRAPALSDPPVVPAEEPTSVVEPRTEQVDGDPGSPSRGAEN
jgi:hypothetical protein